METDPLRPILRDWEAPDPPASLDARVMAAYREAYRPSPWRGFWSARISVPAPLAAALVLIAVASFLEFRPQPVPATIPPVDSQLIAMPAGRGCVTRLDAKGFRPLPDGAARIVDIPEVKQ